MKQFKQFKRAYNIQHENVDSYDNRFHCDYGTHVGNIDDLAYVIKGTEVLWVIMANNYYLDDYEESATEYGVLKDGKWAAVYDGHCSCYGWEATKDDVTYYSNLDELLKCDKGADVILEHKDALVELYPFLSKYFPN
jgi:hypothetical protein